MTSPNFSFRTFLVYAQAIILIVAALYFARTLFIPMSYGLLLAVVLFPVCKKLEKHGWPRSLSITVALLIVIALFAGLLSLLVVEINLFSKDLPALKEKLLSAMPQIQKWLSNTAGISLETQSTWWQDTIHNIMSNPSAMIRNALTATAGTFVTFFLVPVYTALFLYNRGVFVQFLIRITPDTYKERLPYILEQATGTYSKFIKGMVFVYLIVGVLNSTGLFILGIEHAILFGMLTALMTIIPYVGIIISSLLPITVAWLTKDSIWYPVGVIVVLSFVQYMEANIIFPKVVGAQLNVSTWATLVAIIIGGMLWGISGMILFIPFVGILKIVLDQFPAGQVFNILLARSEKKIHGNK
ncbi:MAG: AI-2E family transporter [Chitinophagaceae bacterium]|nr:AI-2E family transporter [Chitinophagaceae bacterium]